MFIVHWELASGWKPGLDATKENLYRSLAILRNHNFNRVCIILSTLCPEKGLPGSLSLLHFSGFSKVLTAIKAEVSGAHSNSKPFSTAPLLMAPTMPEVELKTSSPLF